MSDRDIENIEHQRLGEGPFDPDVWDCELDGHDWVDAGSIVGKVCAECGIEGDCDE